MQYEYKTYTLIVIGIFFVVSVGFSIWQSRQNNRQLRDNERNNGSGFGGWDKVDTDFNGN